MTIQFNISHDAPYGEEVLLNVLVNDDEGNTRAVALDMRTSDGQHWTYKLNNIDRQNQSRIDYFSQQHSLDTNACANGLALHTDLT